MARICKQCKDPAAQPGDDGLCIPCRAITSRRLIKTLLDILKSDWIKSCEGLQFAHGFSLNKMTSNTMGRAVKEAEELMHYDPNKNPFKDR